MWPEALVGEGNTQPLGPDARRIRRRPLPQTVGPPPLEDDGELPGDRALRTRQGRPLAPPLHARRNFRQDPRARPKAPAPW